MNVTLKNFIRSTIAEFLKESEKEEEVLNDSEDTTDEDDEEIDEFCSVGGAGAIGQFGYAVPLGGKSNAKAVEKKKQKK